MTPLASSVAPSSITSPLPQPRRHPLKPGSPKESELIRYLDHGLNAVQLRVENRLQKPAKDSSEIRGYQHFGEIERDIEPLIDVLWVSGSPNLQVPYLLNIARSLTEYLPLFPASPKATFRLLDKLDLAFSSLLQGKDADKGEPLPGFENGRTVSITDKVRLKGIVDRTRLVVVRTLGDELVDEEGEALVREDEAMPNDDTVKFEGFENNDSDDEEDDEDWKEAQIGRVYERTIGELGDVLGGPPIGIITEE
ncbi:uncharacterized protein EI97DRAFT_383565 [Westerdykella ornata]|uniref:Uncharacterized protein n=1 Tax=Westerdykella ornata TaxID=318751 RepID=A0A6A6JAZ5_WESOR|nr:uncharacterized protein EI97DRAFT_383565 [Westerdykella ornata]KAF2273455.1 hypothetical protein EI97DRAFT_383565 [Westerdykella ornata]